MMVSMELASDYPPVSCKQLSYWVQGAAWGYGHVAARNGLRMLWQTAEVHGRARQGHSICSR